MERTRSQYANQIALVLRGTTQVRFRVRLLGSESGCLPDRLAVDFLAVQSIFRSLCFDRSRPGIRQADSHSFADVPGIESVLARQICGLMQRIRLLNFYKRPGIAETLDWASALLALNRHELDRAAVEETLGCIFKYKEDIERMKDEMVNKTLDLDLVLKESAEIQA